MFAVSHRGWNYCARERVLYSSYIQEAIMADGVTGRGPLKDSRLSLSEDDEIRHASKKFDRMAHNIELVIRKIDNSTEVVEKALKALKAA